MLINDIVRKQHTSIQNNHHIIDFLKLRLTLLHALVVTSLSYLIHSQMKGAKHIVVIAKTNSVKLWQFHICI
jgi:hypothetical protein